MFIEFGQDIGYTLIFHNYFLRSITLSYPNAKYYITFLTQYYKEFEASLEPTVWVGHPKKYIENAITFILSSSCCYK